MSGSDILDIRHRGLVVNLPFAALTSAQRGSARSIGEQSNP